MALAISPHRPRRLYWLSLPLRLGLYIGVFVACEQLVSWLHLPLPANIVGMLLMLASTAQVVDRLYCYEIARAARKQGNDA